MYTCSLYYATAEPLPLETFLTLFHTSSIYISLLWVPQHLVLTHCEQHSSWLSHKDEYSVLSLEQNMKPLILINWMDKQENRCSKRFAPMYMRVRVRKVQTMVLLVLPYFCWLHLLHKQLNNEVESPSIYGVGRTGLSAPEGGSIQHTPHLVAPLARTGGNMVIWGAVFLADLQVAAWASYERPAHFLETPVAAVGLRTVLRALSALGMINGAAHSLYPEGNWACNILEAAERLPEPLSMVGLQHFGYYGTFGCPFRDIPATFVVFRMQSLAECFERGKKKPTHYHHP